MLIRGSYPLRDAEHSRDPVYEYYLITSVQIQWYTSSDKFSSTFILSNCRGIDTSGLLGVSRIYGAVCLACLLEKLV